MKLLYLLLLCSGAARAELQVFACEPEWAALAEELGGDLLRATSATTAQQDPHHIQARPGLIARLRSADLLFCTGAGLEAGWLPLLLRRAGNPRVLPGKPGYIEAASAVSLLERPLQLDRSAGDLHALGNPHLHTDPRNLLPVARLLVARLQLIEPGNRSAWSAQLEAFENRWQARIRDWEQRATPLRGMPVVVQHSSWIYLLRWLGLEQVATLEPKPGVPPSSADLAQLLGALERQPARAILHAGYQDDRAVRWLAERAAIPIVELPYTVGGSTTATDLAGVYEETLQRLLQVVQQ